MPPVLLWRVEDPPKQILEMYRKGAEGKEKLWHKRISLVQARGCHSSIKTLQDRLNEFYITLFLPCLKCELSIVQHDLEICNIFSFKYRCASLKSNCNVSNLSCMELLLFLNFLLKSTWHY